MTTRLKTLQRQVHDALRMYDWPWSLEKEMVGYFDADSCAIQAALNELIRANKVRKINIGDGVYYEIP